MKKEDPFLDNADEWKNQASFGSISIITYEEPYLPDYANRIKHEIDITCHGLSKEEFDQWKSEIVRHHGLIGDADNKLIFTSFSEELKNI
ncbi:hypothetical protein MATR_19960 [Marivirga tractuosa]|uniref:Uncharacterized protein n=1 Tax=Marivirga tractuosa (strain ATCC 23168 / DSM 4126 / NBRC 15989 / NCIMB 1408 / VKM B-1430 / H-43) TaxID=643867 RepID=E4TMT7_MARTH|nr:hypothetical protein [Marivirga tractuosa]ADR20385.1 hypothetical protein Ftrac_0378 [Marivirga tractuosa DSM 4126]BDD15171.1 hypothetical protein MATR_19960 [Marivirga tractuosa]